MVSLLGSFTVTILSFVLPPALHLQLVVRPQLAEEERYRRERSVNSSSSGPHDSLYLKHHGHKGQYSMAEDDPEEASEGGWESFAWLFGDRVKTKVGTLHMQYIIDIVLTILGCCVCIFTTLLTADEAHRKFLLMGSC